MHGEVRPGEPYLWEDDHVQILNFPTKRDWREDSRLEDIELGLKFLAKNYQDLGIQSLALGKFEKTKRWPPSFDPLLFIH